MLSFREYGLDVIWKRKAEQGYYDYYEVEKNFYKVIDTLGKFDKRDLIVKIDLRVKNKISTWEVLDNVCSVLRIKISQRFLKRESRFRKLPFARAIEEKDRVRGHIKNHAHILIRMKDLKQYYDESEIKEIIEGICYGMNEVNEKRRKEPNPPVNICFFPYSEQENQLGREIEYICKTSTKTNDPLANGLFKN